MSWASKREVSRIEDEAYSLMGIFQVNMPLLYGERSKAFLRLEEEIIRRSPDQSIFAWTIPSEVFPAAASEAVSGLFATSPLHFADCASVEPCVTPELSERQPFAMTNMGLDLRLQSQMRTWGNQDDNEDEEPYFALHLHCARRREDGVKEMVRVLVQTVGLNRAGMLRIHTNPVNDTVWTDHGSSRPRKFYVKAFMPVRYMARPSRDVKRVQKE
ncbi:Vegetative incompatibility protein HET-E-1 [Pseudocercospora fuligena]|uniref:Vegetative incompatibility protein HET-E-1 n=1 Tax=Pseudocercospora fuligena TaxID=685502 RepID=A0A8H6VLJ3_9PEZI|nr:Vegetative incompatibility protein HET-E-1 [Pseudocercospora fuligena]